VKKRWIIPIVIALSLLFNFGFALAGQNSDEIIPWLFVDVGPAVMQDSYYIRSPGLESLYGIIGDVPGGYPLYSGNPLQSGSPANITFISNTIEWSFGPPSLDMSSVFLAIICTVIPLGLILILGRRSYGSTKTQ
jgi:hypothetical protein